MGFRSMTSYKWVTLSAWGSKVVQAASGVLVMKLLISYLGVNSYAVIVVLTTVSGWFSLFNFGFPTAFQNFISEKRVKKEDYYYYYSRFNGLMLLVFVFNSFVAIPVVYLLSRKLVPGVSSWLLIANLYIFNAITVLTSIYNVFYAEHRGYYSNLLPMCATILTLVLILFLSYFSIAKSLALGAFVLFLPQMLFALFGYTWILRAKFTIDTSFIKQLFRHSRYFFVFSLFAAGTLQIDTLVISRYLKAEDLVTYNILVKIFGLVAFFYAAYLSAVMPLSAEMQRKYEYAALNRIIRNNLQIGFFFIIAATLLLLIFRNYVFDFFSKQHLSVGPGLILIMCGYQLLRVWTDTFAMLLQSVNKMKIFVRFVFVQALLSIGCQVFLVRYLGLVGIMSGLILSYLATVAWFLPYEYLQIRKKYV